MWATLPQFINEHLCYVADSQYISYANKIACKINHLLDIIELALKNREFLDWGLIHKKVLSIHLLVIGPLLLSLKTSNLEKMILDRNY